MAIPFGPFLLFVGVFSMVAVILIAKIRSDARAAAKNGNATLPTARINGRRTSLRQRVHGPGAYAYGLAVSVLLSAITCGVLAYVADRPKPDERRTYQIVNPFDGTAETRELTEKEFHEQYESGAEALKNMRADAPETTRSPLEGESTPER